MTGRELKRKYLDFFKKKGHVIIPSVPLIPENDPSVLFVTAGMHPLVPYLLGEKHPGGDRLTSVQKCIRTNDIDEVGDTAHHTFFEMLGNWSLGDYWKKESLTWSLEFLLDELKLKKDRIWVTCFEGDKDAPKDAESEKVWLGLGIPSAKVFFLGKKDNWWGPAGSTGPCGPDSEIFYDVTRKPCGRNCRPGDNCGRFFEIWNNVFMEYNKTESGKYEQLLRKNVDTGMGVERTAAVVQGLSDNYEVKDLWREIISTIKKGTGKEYKGNERSFRVIADHVRSAVFAIGDGVLPSNKEQGYVLRRLIRRAVRYAKQLGAKEKLIGDVSNVVIDIYSVDYPELKQEGVTSTLQEEVKKFGRTLEEGMREVQKYEELDGKIAFRLYESYGFPLELTEEIAKEKGQKVSKKEFEVEFEKHKEKSRSASAGRFKGGLADSSEKVKQLHTVTHLLHEALRRVLGERVTQKGSNITRERARFDFACDKKLTDEEKEKVERMINEQIGKKLEVTSEVMTLEEARKARALAFFGGKYGEKVKVYSVGKFSKEVCGGPHVSNLGEIEGRVRIIKEEAVGEGIRRIYAVIEKTADE